VRVLADAALRAGGTVAWYATPEGERPYELNVSLFDLLADIGVGEDGWQVARHVCAHTIMMALEGVPAIYVHSLLATSNDLEGVRLTGRPRSINRRRLEVGEADRLLDDPSSPQAQVFTELRRRIALRAGQPAFHPNATQFTLQAGPRVFAFWRQSLDRSQSIFALNNVGATPQEVPLSAINLIATDPWLDLISGRPVTDIRDHLALGPYESAWLTNRIPPEPGPS
jgi:sucrose phosphorylase